MFTEEQLEIINYNFEDNTLVVDAAPGSGKTTTAHEFLKKRNKNTKLYLVYNKEMRETAIPKFNNLDRIKIYTFHAYIMKKMDYIFKDKTTLEYSYVDIMKDIKIEKEIAVDVEYYWQIWLYSAYKEFDFINFEKIEPKGLLYINEIKKYLSNLFFYKKDVENLEVKIELDFYLKYYQLYGDKIINFEYLVVDEAQDINPCIIDIIKNKIIAKKLIIGDTHQKIYGWRGCNNALEIIEGEKKSLTYSFRVGDFTAKLCSFVINNFKKKIKDTHKMVGMNKKQIIVEKFSIQEPYLILCRKNKTVLSEIIRNSKEDKKIYCVGGANKYLKKTEFKDINFVENIKEADIYVSNIHQVKGLEFERVKVMDDVFNAFSSNKYKFYMTEDQIEEEVNLLFISLSRATKELIIPDSLFSYLLQFK